MHSERNHRHVLMIELNGRCAPLPKTDHVDEMQRLVRVLVFSYLELVDQLTKSAEWVRTRPRPRIPAFSSPLTRHIRALPLCPPAGGQDCPDRDGLAQPAPPRQRVPPARGASIAAPARRQKSYEALMPGCPVPDPRPRVPRQARENLGELMRRQLAAHKAEADRLERWACIQH